MSEIGYVYALVDPSTSEVRYVGATKDPKAREKSHLQRSPNPDVASWINELDDKNLTPDMVILRETDLDGLATVEEEEIERLSDSNDLLNRVKKSGYNPEREWNYPTEIESDTKITATVKMYSNGRIIIPKRVRRMLGVGDESATVEVDIGVVQNDA